MPVLRLIFWGVFARFVAFVLIGVSVRRAGLLPARGPAIVIANHNSHLDTLALMALFPFRLLGRVRPAAAADYFLKNPVRAWFSRHVLGIVAVERAPAPGEDALRHCHEALDAGDILIFFPEGTRGEPEQMAALKFGIAKLAAAHPQAPVVPVFLHGLGKSLPRGDFVLVPFTADALIGPPVPWGGDAPAFMRALEEAFAALASEKTYAPWS